MYDDDDQRQALGQPSLDIAMLEMIVIQEFYFFCFFIFLPSRHLFYRPFSFFHLCNMPCMIMFCPIMPISFDVLLLKTSQCLGQSLPLRPLYRLSFFLNLFFFSSKKEIKSAGTEKCFSFLWFFSI